jgi:hypothetical protein
MALLSGHPQSQSHPGQHKERHIYKETWTSDLADEDVERYARWFPRPEGKLAGEWTPDYMAQLWTPRLLRRSAPNARLLVLLRDPLDRFSTGLTHEQSRGSALGGADLLAALERGRYGTQLERLFQHFPRERVLLLQYEACVRSPQVELQRTFRFLGLDDSYLPPTFARRINATRIAKARLTRELVLDLDAVYRPEVQLLRELWPELNLGLWSHFAAL